MIEVFVLIGWIDGFRSGGVVSQEFNSLATCEAAKTMFVKMHEININDRYRDPTDNWVECVMK